MAADPTITEKLVIKMLLERYGVVTVLSEIEDCFNVWAHRDSQRPSTPASEKISANFADTATRINRLSKKLQKKFEKSK